jgi:uncharacterized protein (DUF58 family)
MISPAEAARLKNLELIARTIVEGFLVGLHRSPFQGFSVEFSEYRPYQPGHSLDQIDWRVFARTNRLYVRRYEEETNLQAYLLIDTSGSMRYPTTAAPKKLDYALFLSAALAYLLIQQRDAVGLYLFDERIRQYLPARSRQTWLRRLFQALEPYRNASPEKAPTLLPQALHQIADRLKRRSLLILLSDFFLAEEDPEPLLQAIARLRLAGHDLLLIRIWDEKTEKYFQLPTEPLHLLSAEDAHQVKIHPIELAPLYQTYITTYEEKLRRFCLGLKIDYLPIDLGTSFFVPLYQYLLKRARLL